MSKPNGWGDKGQALFLNVLASTGNVSAACRAANINRQRAYDTRAKEDAFREAWNGALEDALDELEAELRRRALEGTDKPVYYGGKLVGDVKAYNDNLGMFLLKSRRKDVFGDTPKSKSGPEDNGDDGLDAASVRERLLGKLDSMAGDGSGEDN